MPSVLNEIIKQFSIFILLNIATSIIVFAFYRLLFQNVYFTGILFSFIMSVYTVFLF